jgi:hypothetical protein
VSVVTARDTGAAALASLALACKRTAPMTAMRQHLELHHGDATAAARDLGVGKKSLMAAVSALELDGWLAETWPHRTKGGQGARLGRKVRS